MFWFVASIIAAGIIVYLVITTTLEEWYAHHTPASQWTRYSLAESARIEREADRCISFRIVQLPPYDWAREQSQSIGTALESTDGSGETVTVLLNEEGLGAALESLAMESRSSGPKPLA